MMSLDAPLGLYLHIPFCKRKCRYCDFCSVADASPKLRAAYVDRLIREIKGFRCTRPPIVDTVFFGGGTPSLLLPKQFADIMHALRDVFSVSPDAEITVEANPATVTEELLSVYRAEGVNRISLGLQSIHENEQKTLGRIHTSEDFYESMRMLRSFGFDNINVDIMYGIPDQTEDSFLRTVEAVLAVRPTHISAYSLILEEGTPLCDMRHTLRFPTEDEELAMHERMCRLLTESGFSRYEISNFCLKGYECRHNMKYWRMQPYIGFGAAAHSYTERRRHANTVDISSYILGEDTAESIELSQEDERYEYAMLHLRTSAGFSLAEYRSCFGVSFEDGKEELLSRFVAMGYLLWEGDRICFTDRGMYVSNSLLTEIL